MLAIIMTNISIYCNLDKGENDIAKRTCIFQCQKAGIGNVVFVSSLVVCGHKTGRG